MLATEHGLQPRGSRSKMLEWKQFQACSWPKNIWAQSGKPVSSKAVFNILQSQKAMCVQNSSNYLEDGKSGGSGVSKCCLGLKV